MTGIKIGSVLADGTPVAEAAAVARAAAPSPAAPPALGIARYEINGLPDYLTRASVEALIKIGHEALTKRALSIDARVALSPSKHQVAASVLQGLLRHGVATAWAAGLAGTKDRRDALRAQATVALSDEPSFGWKVGASHFKQGTLSSASKAPGIRNLATQDQLHLLAMGVTDPSLMEAWANDGSEKFRSFLEPFSPMIDELRDDVLPEIRRQIVRLMVSAGITQAELASPGRTARASFEMTEDGEVVGFNLSTTGSATAGAASTTTETTTASTKEAAMTESFVSIPSVEAAIAGDKFNLDATYAGMIDGSLKHLGLPTIGEIGAAFRELKSKGASIKSEGVKIEIGAAMAYTPSSAGVIPAGTCKSVKASVAFGLSGAAATAFDMDVPFYEWDHAHPHVPAVDPGYQFQPAQLLAALVAIITNQRAWFYGDTGCGKTTLIEQVAARLNYPVIRVNFDSEITRMDLIGAKDIIVSGGHPVTTFTEGVLPSAMQMPCIFLADELDFIRADVAYVFQRALEGNGLTLPEDGGRVVNPHPGFRIFATANTQGQGDDSGRYQGAKPQSAAFLDRFTMWIQCNYMTDKQVAEMLTKKHPALPASIKDSLVKYAREHWTAFTNGQLLTALSPRGLLSCAMTYTVLSATIDPKKAFAQAMERTFVDRAGREDAQTIKGLLSRII